MADKQVSFVRHDQIPPSPPPAREKGIIKWLRENLFSNVFSAVLTIIALYIIIQMVIGAFPWFYNGIWDVDSIRACRDALTFPRAASLVAASEHILYQPSVLSADKAALLALLGLETAPPIGEFADIVFPTVSSFTNAEAAQADAIWSKYGIEATVQRPIGACFAVLQDRWDHLLFGFKYPPEAYWRPLLAFVLLIAAAMPALFPMYIDRKMLIYTALYPFLAFWLIWGGTIWVPVTVLVSIILTAVVFRVVERMAVDMRRVLAAIVGILSGIGLAYLLFQGAQELRFIAGNIGGSGLLVIPWALFWLASIFTYIFFIPMGIFVGYTIYQNAEDGGLVTVVTSLLAAYLLFFYALGPVSSAINSIVPLELQAVPSRDMGGFMLSLILGTVCVSLSIPLGIVLALGRQSNMPLIKGVCVVFIEFVRGVPLITLLFVANVMLAYFMPPETNFDLILRVIIMITMFSAAYIAEVIRGGLAALPKGQYEAADSLGLNYTQATRLIILPQALKISIPGIVNVAVGLFKDTTLVSVISMFDVVGMIRGPIQQSTDWISIYWEVYLFAAALFFVVCYGISQYSQWLERQLRTDHR